MIHTTLQHILLSVCSVCVYSCRHRLYALRLYVFLYNHGITQWYYMKQQASANICLFAFKVNPAPFLRSSFPKVQNELQ